MIPVGRTSPTGPSQQGFTHSRRSAQQGFTLIELLAAMIAGSLILATLSWTLASLGRELRASTLAEPRQRLSDVAPALTRLIEQAQPTARGETQIVATPKRFAFTTAPPSALGAAGSVRAELSVRSGESGEGLYARFAPADSSAALPPGATAEVPLVEGYRTIGFDYRLPKDNEAGLPPRLVTISLTDKAGRTTRLAAAPRLTAAGDCRFDPVSMACRR
ncbi:MAG TPA: prepilin-type N-terminal cleavage/methylation domain-containing protein [Allosphingosinicella sp.]|nr:prepilin-type N-terminal cleavage/methylation domain-containing protein [Allosphingosinicella sp.]